MIGAVLGDGWYCGHVAWFGRQVWGKQPRLLVQLEIKLENGQQMIIISDENWKTAYGPLLQSELIMGEHYDARLEFPGWSQAGFDDRNWPNAKYFPDPGCVRVTDFIQFGIAMTGAVALAVFALRQPEVGGLAGLLAKTDPATLNLLPDFGDWGLTLAVLVMPLTVQWWSVWYPGSEPGGGSYIAQRMLASKSERDALGSTLLFNVAHYALRSWPWILALASLLVFPTLDDIRRAFPWVDPELGGHDMAYPAMLKFLPPGLAGVKVAGLLAAYVSTIVTHLNWGTSYLVHDFYRRFVRPDASERHYVLAGRVTTGLLMGRAGGGGNRRRDGRREERHRRRHPGRLPGSGVLPSGRRGRPRAPLRDAHRCIAAFRAWRGSPPAGGGHRTCDLAAARHRRRTGGARGDHGGT